MREILAYLGEPSSPTRMAPARSPPLWEGAGAGQDRFDPNGPTGTRPRIRSAHRMLGAKTKQAAIAVDSGLSCGSDRVATLSISQRLSAQNPRLTAAARQRQLPKVPLDFLSF